MAHAKLKTVDDVIEALGGLKAVSEITGSSQSAVWNWRDRGAFPSKKHVVMTGALERRGLVAPLSLWGVEEPSNA